MQITGPWKSKFVDCFGGPDKALDSFSDIQKAINFSMTSFLITLELIKVVFCISFLKFSFSIILILFCLNFLMDFSNSYLELCMFFFNF